MATRAKSGIVEVQLNWIFVLIAGAVILVVFFSFAQKQRSAARVEIANTIIQDIETIITSAGASKGVAQVIQVPDAPLGFTCSEECACAFSVYSVSHDFQEKLIFAAEELEGNELILWSLPWEAPYRVQNLVYLTNKRVPIYFIHNEDDASKTLVETIKKELPNSLETQILQQERVQGIRNQNYDDAVFVFVNMEPTFDIHQSFTEIKVRAVKITESGERGTASFYTKDINERSFEQQATVSYIGRAARYAAIFANSDDMLTCQLDRLYKKYAYVTKVYQKRTEQLPSAACEKGYQGADNIFSAMSVAIDALQEEGTIEEVSQYIDELAAYNEDLLLQSCPLIY